MVTDDAIPALTITRVTHTTLGSLIVTVASCNKIFPVKKNIFTSKIFFSSLTDAVGEVVIARGALVTESPAVILATRALEENNQKIYDK